MKKVCIYLTNVHANYYLLLGFVIGIISFYSMSDFEEWRHINGIIGFPVLFLLILSPIATSEFYARDDRATRDVFITNSGLVLQDKYFSIKINTELSITKRLFGYFYAITRPFIILELGNMLSAIVCILTSAKAL